MKTYTTNSAISLTVVACLTSFGILAAQPNMPVSVENTVDNPVPVAGDLTVDNTAANPVPVVIQDPVQVTLGTSYRYAGTTTLTSLPNIGLNGMNAMCRSDYGEQARMCSTKEFFQTPDPAETFNDEYWVRPIQVTSVYVGSMSQVISTEWTGLQVTGKWSDAATCRQWTTTEINTGIVLDLNRLGFHRATVIACNTPRRAVCCAPHD